MSPRKWSESLLPKSFFPMTLEEIASVLANLIVIGTFLFGLLPAARWARSVQRESAEIRRRLRPAAALSFLERETLQHIQLVRQLDELDLWEISWSQLRNMDDRDIRRGVARITAKRLLNVLRQDPKRIKASKTAIVVGTVDFVLGRDQKPSSINVSKVVYISGDGFLRKVWLAVRRSIARLFGQIV